MTAPGTFPTMETNQKIQANIVAAKYDVQRLSIAPADAIDTPPGLQTFSPKSSQNTAVTFTNTTGAPVNDLTLSITVPSGWKSVVLSSTESSKKFAEPIAPGASVNATFMSLQDRRSSMAIWLVLPHGLTSGKTQSEIAIEKVRNVDPVKINEFRISDGSTVNSTNTFIELYNAGDSEIDISDWTLPSAPDANLLIH